MVYREPFTVHSIKRGLKNQAAAVMVFVMLGIAGALTLLVSPKYGSWVVIGTVYALAAARMFLPAARLGVLAIRTRAIDVITMCLFATALLVITVSRPDLWPGS